MTSHCRVCYKNALQGWKVAYDAQRYFFPYLVNICTCDTISLKSGWTVQANITQVITYQTYINSLKFTFSTLFLMAGIAQFRNRDNR